MAFLLGAVVGTIVLATNFLDMFDTLDRFWKSTLPSWIKWFGAAHWGLRLFVVVVLLGVFAALVVGAARTRDQRRKKTLISIGLFPAIAFGIIIVQNPSEAEVVTRNIGVIHGHRDNIDIGEISSAVASDLQYELGVPGRIRVLGYDLSRDGFDPALLRSFIKENFIRYLILAEELPPTQLEALRRQASELALVIVTAPQRAPSDDFKSGAVGVYLPPEDEADYVAAQLADKQANPILLVWEEQGAAPDYGHRFKARLSESLPLERSPVELPLSSFLRDARLRQSALARSKVVVIAGATDSVAKAADLASGPNREVVVTNRYLDYRSVFGAGRKGPFVAMPWRLSALYAGRPPNSVLSREVDLRTLRMRDMDTLAAVTVAVAFQSEHSAARPNSLRDLLFRSYRKYSNYLADIYGDSALAEGQLPHLRPGPMKLYRREQER